MACQTMVIRFAGFKGAYHNLLYPSVQMQHQLNH